MTQPAVPVINLGSLYMTGFQLSWLTGTTLSVAPGQCRDSTNTCDILYKGPDQLLYQDGMKQNPDVVALPATITINAAVNGLNGLDTGALANSTFYAVFVVSDSYSNHPTGAIISLSATAPALPNGYDIFRRIGFVKTSGAAALLEFLQTGLGSRRKMWYGAPIVVLAATAAAAMTAQSLVAAVPVAVGQTDVMVQADLLPNAAANFVQLRATGSAVAAGNVKMSGDVAGVHHFDQLTVPAAVAAGVLSIDWMTDAASTVALTVSGYVDNL